MNDNSSEDALHAVVLAAGCSSRFGSPKQLVRIAGRPLLNTMVGRAVDVAGSAVIVVLGSGAAELAPLIVHSPAQVVINRDWREGMASSIRAGLSRLPASCAGVMLVLVDQAAVTSQDLQRLAAVWRRQPGYIAAARYGTTTGVPAVFPRSTFADLAELRGDVGAKAVLQRNPDRIVRVSMPSGAIDLDTPEDLLALGGGARDPGTISD